MDSDFLATLVEDGAHYNDATTALMCDQILVYLNRCALPAIKIDVHFLLKEAATPNRGLLSYVHINPRKGEQLKEWYAIQVPGIRKKITLWGKWFSERGVHVSFDVVRFGFCAHEVRHRVQRRKRVVKFRRYQKYQISDPLLKKALALAHAHFHYVDNLENEFDCVVVQFWAMLAYEKIHADRRAIADILLTSM